MVTILNLMHLLSILDNMNIRELAFLTIDSIYKNKSFSNIEINKIIKDNSLQNQDKSFFTNLVYGTIKCSSLLDYEINQVVTRKDYKPKVRSLLKMSLYQLRYLDKVPSYAIIYESVEIAKKHFGLQTSRFVNAVLRNLSINSYSPKKEDMDYLKYLSIISSLPLWTIEMINKQYGEDKLKTYIENIHKPSRLYFRINILKSNKEEILKNSDFKDGNLSCSVYYCGNKSVSEINEFLDGKITVQSESSQMVSLFLDPKSGDHILDMCAAPGSKTYHMADLIKNNGKITSIDLYPHRISLLNKNLPRLGINCVDSKSYDSTKLNEIFEESSFDKILLDAPCSGLGVIRRKPDIMLDLSSNKLDEIVSLQKSLIDSAIPLLKQGGVFVYSTCTINKKENDFQVDYILKKYPNMKLAEMKTIFPDETNYDGFFMARLVKEQ